MLDAGCGAGTKSAYLAKKGLEVTGIDFSKKLIDIARREIPGQDFIVMDMADVNKLEGGFAGIFAQASLLHIAKKDTANVLQGFVSKLTPNGLLYVAVKGLPLSGIEEETKEENAFGYPYQRFFSYYSLNELLEHFQALGLTIIYKDIKTTGKSDWVQIIGRK